MDRVPRLVIGVTGEFGTGYAVRLLELLAATPIETHVVMCSCARRGIRSETGRDPADVISMADRTYGEWNQAARISSGSFLTLGMIVAPCSPRSLGSIALGYANTLIHRAADVTMKEGRPLVLVVPARRIEEVDGGHVARLEQVPGVRVTSAPPEAPVDRVDGLLVEILAGFDAYHDSLDGGVGLGHNGSRATSRPSTQRRERDREHRRDQ